MDWPVWVLAGMTFLSLLLLTAGSVLSVLLLLSWRKSQVGLGTVADVASLKAKLKGLEAEHESLRDSFFAFMRRDTTRSVRARKREDLPEDTPPDDRTLVQEAIASGRVF